MDNKITVTCVSENTSLRHSLLAQHGQSLHINYFGNQYLFDVAEVYEGFIYNLKQLNINLNKQRAVIISHRDLDHCGSLPKLLSQLTQPLWLPDDMQKIKEDRYIPTYREINGQQIPIKEVVEKLLSYPQAKVISEGQEIEKGFYTTGSLSDGIREQSLVMDIPNKGIIVIVACSHPTLPLIIDTARKVSGVEKICGLIGGFHYKGLADEQIKENVAYLENINPDFIVPSHCTGYRAIRVLQAKLGDKVHLSGTGQFGTGNSIDILPELLFNLPSK